MERKRPISITRYKCPGELVNLVKPQQTNWILCYEIGLFTRLANKNQLIYEKKVLLFFQTWSSTPYTTHCLF